MTSAEKHKAQIAAWHKEHRDEFRWFTGFRLRANAKLQIESGDVVLYTPDDFFYRNKGERGPYHTLRDNILVHLPTSLCRRAKTCKRHEQIP